MVGGGGGTPEVTSGGIFRVLVEWLCLQFGCCVLQKKQHVEPIMYMTEWFMCLFTRNLSWGCVLRLWDIFLCEGEDWGGTRGCLHTVYINFILPSLFWILKWTVSLSVCLSPFLSLFLPPPPPPPPPRFSFFFFGLSSVFVSFVFLLEPSYTEMPQKEQETVLKGGVFQRISLLLLNLQFNRLLKL